MKLHGRSTAVIATSIFLLMNLSEVLKAIVKLTVNVETFFSLNMVPIYLYRNPSWNSPSRKILIWMLTAINLLRLWKFLNFPITGIRSSSEESSLIIKPVWEKSMRLRKIHLRFRFLKVIRFFFLRKMT